MSSLTITTIQADLFWEDKSANLAMFDARIRAITEKTEIVVLPEMFSTGFSMQPEKLAETMDGPTIHWMKQVSAEKKIIITGDVAFDSNIYKGNRHTLEINKYGTLIKETKGGSHFLYEIVSTTHRQRVNGFLEEIKLIEAEKEKLKDPTKP